MAELHKPVSEYVNPEAENLTKSYDAGAFSIEISTTDERGLELVTTENVAREPLIGTVEDLRGTQDVKVSAQQDRRKLSIEIDRQEGNTLFVKVTPAFFNEYQKLRDNAEVPKPTGTAMALFTTESDGSSKLLLQYRAPFTETKIEEGKVIRSGNKFYGGIPGASVAGIWNADWAVIDGNKVKIMNVDTQAALKNILDEMGHEIGLSPEDLILAENDTPSARIVGFCVDHVNPHTEVMMYGKSRLSSEEIVEKAEVHKKERGYDEFDFSEKFFFMEGTPEAIEKLLTDVKCPLPPTHAAAFEEAGYMLVLQQGGLEKALEWKERIRVGIKDNYGKMDQLVRDFYSSNPKMYNHNKTSSEKEGRSLRDGYDAAFSPEQQGLPSLEAELLRTALVDLSGSKDVALSPEKEKQPVHGWMFDADGVLFDAHDPNVKIPLITEFIISRLQKGEAVTINSGRGVSFALDKMLPSLREKGITNELLDHMIFVGQKGAEVGRFVSGEPVIEIDESMKIPDYLRESVFDLIQAQFADTMFEGEIKPTMISPQRRGVEQGREVPHDEFHREQERLVPMLKELLRNYNLDGKFKVDATNIATDIESITAGKDLGARKILDWMREKGLFPQQFHAFGDSKSDQQMADEIHKQGYPIEYIWTGKRGAYDREVLPYLLTIPDGEHDEATANYFTSFSDQGDLTT